MPTRRLPSDTRLETPARRFTRPLLLLASVPFLAGLGAVLVSALAPASGIPILGGTLERVLGSPLLGAVASEARPVLAPLLEVFVTDAQAQEYSTRSYQTRRIEGAPPVLDGRVDDDVWNLVEWAGEFREHSPNRGEDPSQQTAFKILYDDNALYVAYRAFDDHPEEISSQTTRRDWFPGDWVEINIDSRFDQRTAFSFTSSVSGVRGDEFISQDGDNWDGDWDPIWTLRTAIDDRGWTAEVEIPLSQLRFSDQDEQVWGIQVTRRVFREEERSCWQPIPLDTPGWVSRFGELHGIRGLRPERQVEILPYAVTRAERFPRVKDDPFATGSDESLALGVDGKLGVLGNLTLDFTINPDFGQVEADPSEVNLSAFETFFSEKRPFFIEGSDILEYRLAPAVTGGSFTQDRLFYSRRIGRAPRYFPGDDGAHVDMPENSSIIGAAKLTGKTKSGLSVGVLESVTARERADVEQSGVRSQETVEPTTNFFVGRVRQDLRNGQTVMGAMVTAVNRNIQDEPLAFLHDAAYSGGVDFLHMVADRRYYVEGNVSFSRVEGDPVSIRLDQLSSARYYQRPDASYVDFDSTRTSLSGTAGSVRVGKSGGGITRFQTGVAWRSPGFETNDMGFLRRADEINQFTWGALSFNQPFSIFNRIQWNANQWTNYDYGGTNTSNAVNTNFNLNFRNNWSTGAGITRNFDYVSNTALRGGPSSKWPGSWERSFWVNSDSRKPVSYGFGGGRTTADENSAKDTNYWVDVNWRPNGQMRLSLSPSYSTYDTDLQYVTTRNRDSADPGYMFAALDQETAACTFRLDYAIAPDLTVQLYGQPFLATGRYHDFKQVTDPKADRYEDRFVSISDEEADGLDRSFNFRDFNSNVVVRWEFQPGSLLYLVWNQSRQGSGDDPTLSVGDDVDGLFNVQPHDIFLIKVSRWFSL